MHGLDQPLILGLWGMYSKAAEGLNATTRFGKYLPANGAVEGARGLPPTRIWHCVPERWDAAWISHARGEATRYRW